MMFVSEDVKKLEDALRQADEHVYALERALKMMPSEIFTGFLLDFIFKYGNNEKTLCT